MTHPALRTSIDWSSWEPGSEPSAAQARDLAALIETAVGANGDWRRRADARGSLLASIEDSRLDRLAAAVTDAVARGDSVDTLEAALGDVLDNTTWADLVATTEMARAMTQASLLTYASNGAPGYSVVTSSDDRVCQACSENEDNSPFPMGTAPTNGYPPSHPLCRCATVADFSLPSTAGAGDAFGGDLEAEAEAEAEDAGVDTAPAPDVAQHDTSGQTTDLAGNLPQGVLSHDGTGRMTSVVPVTDTTDDGGDDA